MVYMGNKKSMEVHMLLDPQATCQIDKIKSENKKYFQPDTLDQAHLEGYDNCAHCLGGSKR